MTIQGPILNPSKLNIDIDAILSSVPVSSKRWPGMRSGAR
jgi:hypothetical protein